MAMLFPYSKAMSEATSERSKESSSGLDEVLQHVVSIENASKLKFRTPIGVPADTEGRKANACLQGKVAELRLELNSGNKKDKNNAAKKIALKKIVANMTMSNNDMVALFPDVVGCMQIPSLEIKKMYVPFQIM